MRRCGSYAGLIFGGLSAVFGAILGIIRRFGTEAVAAPRSRLSHARACVHLPATVLTETPRCSATSASQAEEESRHHVFGVARISGLKPYESAFKGEEILPPAFLQRVVTSTLIAASRQSGYAALVLREPKAR